MSTETLQGPYVFLSYSRSEGVVAKRLEQDLRVHGFQVWRDISSIDPGSPDWEEAVREGISHAYAVVLIASPSVIQSHYIKGELSLAKLYHPNRIYPVWVDGTDWPDCVPIDFINTEYIDMRGEQYEEGFKVLVTMLQKAKEQPSPSPLQPDIKPPAQPPPPPPPRRRFPKGLVLIVGLVLLLIVSSGIVYYTTIFRPNQRHLQATATAQARVNATATAIVTVYQNLYNQSTSGTPAISNPLNGSTTDSNWTQDTVCQFSGGAYHVSETDITSFNVCEATLPFNNFTYQVQMKIIKGDDGGIAFDDNSSSNVYYGYVFLVGQDGSYEFFACPLKSSQCNSPLLLGSSSAINRGLNQTNLVTVIVTGNTFTFYVNKQEINSVTDSTFSHGSIGVIAYPFNKPTEVVYSNARVWTFRR